MTCCNCVKTTDIVVYDGSLILTIPNQTLTNGQQVNICLAQTIPEFTGELAVQVYVNGDWCQIITRYIPEYLYTDQLKQTCCGSLKSRQMIPLRFASDSHLFLYDGVCSLPQTEHLFVNFTPPASTSTSTETENDVTHVGCDS